ncbi:high-affinity branched-chain amino acid ABC transporter permease LivM [Candidatus Hartigia pinicola]
MRKKHWINAIITSIVYFILVIFIMGLQLRSDDTKLIVSSADAVRWNLIFLGVVVVFIFQLVNPLLFYIWNNARKKFWITPLFDRSTFKIKELTILVIIFAILFPFIVSPSSLDIITLTLIYIMLGLGLNVVVGLSGLLVLGYAGFYAIGAYTFALLNHYYGFSFWESFPIVGFTAGLAGCLLGLLVLRLRGDYLAIVTLGFGEIVRILLLNNTNITNGSNGINQLPTPTFFGLDFGYTEKTGWDTFHHFFNINYNQNHKIIFVYFMTFLLVILTVFIINRLLHMPLGRAWEALREDEIACRSLGLSPIRIKLTAFIISSVIAGFAGMLFASHQGCINPEYFTFSESAFILAIVVLGGMKGSQTSVIISATVLVISREMIRDLNGYSMLILGVLMVLIMIFFPQGLFPIKRRQIKLNKILPLKDQLNKSKLNQ